MTHQKEKISQNKKSAATILKLLIFLGSFCNCISINLTKLSYWMFLSKSLHSLLLELLHRSEKNKISSKKGYQINFFFTYFNTIVPTDSYNVSFFLLQSSKKIHDYQVFLNDVTNPSLSFIIYVLVFSAFILPWMFLV